MKFPPWSIVFFYVAVFMPLSGADFLSELGASKDQIEGMVTDSITSGFLYMPRGIRIIPTDRRVTIVQEVGVFAKAYVQTEEFKGHYAEWWKSHEPAKPISLEEMAAEQKQREEESAKAQVQSMEDLKVQIKTTEDAALKKQLHEILDAMVNLQAQMKIQTEAPEYKQRMKEVQEAMKKAEAEQYQQDLTEYQKKHQDWQDIQDPNVLIKRGLQKFLSETEGVDFEAALTTEDTGRKQFVKPEYQSKPYVWKQAFRAGKAVVDTARGIAQEWLKTI